MNKSPYLILLWSVILLLTACSNRASMESAGVSVNTGKQTTSVSNDTLPMNKEALTQIYTRAIAAFIQAARQNNQTTFDTLFFGKHVYGQPDDFPDIELPETIEHTPVRLISPEVGQKKQQERRSLVYVNMMGWVEQQKAEFILVVFSNGAEHQYDYHINFTIQSSDNQLHLDKIEFENYRHLNGKKPQRIVIYQNGKYVEER